MKLAATAIATALLVTASCTTTPTALSPQMYYNCDVQVTNAYGTFIARPHQLQWRTRLPGNVYMSLEYFVWLKPGPGEAVRMFEGLADNPELYVGWYDNRWEGLRRRRDPMRSAQARVGGVMIATSYPFQTSGYFTKVEV